MPDDLTNTITWDNHGMEMADKALNWQIRYAQAIIELQKGEQQVLQMQIQNASAVTDLRQKQWRYTQQQQTQLAFRRAMAMASRELENLKSDYIGIGFVVQLLPRQLARMWSSWDRLSRNIQFQWYMESMQSFGTRLDVVNQCRKSTPAVGSPVHYALMDCFSATRVIADEKAKYYAGLYDAAMNRQIDIWKT